MNKVFACIDGIGNTAAVCDYAAWSALRLDVPLEFLHVLDRHPERAAVSDLSGSIGVDTQTVLLQELSVLDEQRSRLAQAHGRELLESAQRRAAAAGVSRTEARQRHGEFVEAVLDMEPDARLFVLGQHYHATGRSKIHLDHHVERVIRAVKRPVLVATSDHYREPRRFAIAFDGSQTGRKMIDTIASSPLLRDMPCHVVFAGDASASVQEQSRWACETLKQAAFEVQGAVVPGEPEVALAKYVGEHGIDLLVMGAYGHSRLRHLIVGSTTTTMLRTSDVPVLILR